MSYHECFCTLCFQHHLGPKWLPLLQCFKLQFCIQSKLKNRTFIGILNSPNRLIITLCSKLLLWPAVTNKQLRKESIKPVIWILSLRRPFHKEKQLSKYLSKAFLVFFNVLYFKRLVLKIRKHAWIDNWKFQICTVGIFWAVHGLF